MLELIHNNSRYINFIDSYAKFLIDKYPEEIISLYAGAIKSHAKIADKRIYKEVSDYLKHLSKIKGSENVLRQLLYYFRGIYRNRKTMMEILNENFPEKK